jgi:3-hydroxyisobutyrate dehydrogenase-like beta-hydroxyacid dehydrogenase
MGVNVGFIGLGTMGLPMSRNVLKGGYRVYGYDINPLRMEEFRKFGGAICNSIGELVRKCDCIHIVVLDDKQVKDVMLGEDGVVKNAVKPLYVAIHSTILPSTCVEVAGKASQFGVKVIDAPISGGPIGAEEGSLTFMVGGDKEAFEKLKPILELMGKNIFYLGALGSGLKVKLLNNLMLYCNNVIAAEAIEIAKKMGISESDFLNVVNTSSGGSWVTQKWESFNLLKWIDSKPGFVELILKDIEDGVKTIYEHGLRSIIFEFFKGYYEYRKFLRDKQIR